MRRRPVAVYAVFLPEVEVRSAGRYLAPHLYRQCIGSARLLSGHDPAALIDLAPLAARMGETKCPKYLNRARS